MRVIRAIAGVGATKKPAQDAPGAIFSRGAAALVPPFSDHAHPERSHSYLNMIDTFRAVEDDVDAATPVDAQNAPTAVCKSRTEREIRTAPTAVLVFLKRKRRRTSYDPSPDLRGFR